MKEGKRMFGQMNHVTRKKTLKWISVLLILSLLVTLPGTFLLDGNVVLAETEEVDLVVTDLVQVAIGNQVETLLLYNNGVYEAKVELGASQDADASNMVSENNNAITAKLLVNGQEVKTKEIEISSQSEVTVYFRIQDGIFLDSVNDSEYWHTASWTGGFDDLSLLDDSGNSMTITQWEPDDENSHLVYQGGGIYAREFQFETLTEDTDIKYKSTFNGTLDNAIGDSISGDEDGNIQITIPAGEDSIIVWVDAIGKVAYDNIRTEAFDIYQNGESEIKLLPFESIVSAIGTIRGSDPNSVDWDAAVTGYEYTQISDSLYIYQKQFAAGIYSHKVVFDYQYWYEKSAGNKSLTIEQDGTNVVFLYNADTQEIFDSVNDAEQIGMMIGMETIPAEAKVINNKNGTSKFVTLVNDDDKSADVILVYGDCQSVSDNGEGIMEKVQMSKQKDGSYATGDIFLGDEALDIVFYYLVDGNRAIDQSDNLIVIDGYTYCRYKRDAFTGRLTCVPGTFPGPSWNEASNEMTYIGGGLYKYEFEDVPPANYEHKISHGSWDENYGAKGVLDGPNIKVVVTEEQDVTVYYSDLSHYSRTSIDYEFGADVKLKGTGLAEDPRFDDSRLTGIYSVTVPLSAGTYPDIQIIYKEQTLPIDEFELEDDKNVTFYFDPSTDIYYHNASDVEVATKNIYYDTQDLEYKSVYGAVETGEEVTYSIQTGDDAKSVKMIVKGKERMNLDMDEVIGNIDGDGNGIKKWSTNVSFNGLGEYSYFFVISNGGAITIYGDDDGYYGTGIATDLLNVMTYDQIVYQAGYETPNWMKNATIYQIFPERFFDGDVSNNRAQTNARGAVDYEYVTNWYLYPENPEQMELHPNEYPAEAYKGDGEWHNDIYGGDLKGVTEKIGYLKALGVNVIYLNPVFSSISSHRYDASDYGSIDPILGTEGDFDELVTIAEENGMHVVLDGVFNHVADDSKYFDRYYKFLEKIKDSDDSEKKIGAYPYWAYVYDQMNEENMEQQVAEGAAKEYFETEYGITDWTYTGWFDFNGEDQYILEDDGKTIVKDSIGLRAGKEVYAYDCWWGYDSMPVILATNGSEYQTPGFAEEIIGKNETSEVADGSITQYWLDKGMDGWRLDVANEVSDETWQHFRQSVKALDSDNVIIGEIWTDAIEYLMGDMYDSVMNYVFRGAVLKYAMGGDAKDYNKTLEKLRERYPEEAFYAMMNLVGSHDTTRILSYLDGIDDDRNQKEPDKAFPTYEKTSDLAKKRQYLVAFLQFTYPGAPTIYYGDEIGMVGSDDPDDRRAMTWGKGKEELVNWYATLGNIRQEYEVLRTGNIEVFDTGKDEIVSFVRSKDDEKAVVFANNSEEAVTVSVSANDLGLSGAEFVDVLTGQAYVVAGDKLAVEVPALSGMVLIEADQVRTVEVDTASLKAAYDSGYIVSDAKVTVSKTSANLKKGDKLTLTATGRGEITWSTSNARIATVSNGVVTAIGDGAVNIIATHEDGLTATCKVTVGSVIPANSITLNKSSANVEKGKTLALTAKIAPSNATDKSVTWSSSNSKVATVKSNGMVEAKATGNTTITAKTANGKTATCKVTVVVSSKKVYTLSNVNLVKGKTKKLSATMMPKNTTDKINWKSKNKKVVKVDKKGNIKGIKAGSTKVIAKSTSGKQAVCNVTVVAKPQKATSVKCSKKNVSLKVDNAVQLKVTMKPKKATDTLKFTSDNKKVATVDKNGVVYAKKRGNAKITVKTSSGKKASCNIKVKK